MRLEGSVTSVSWIPLQAVEGLLEVPFEFGVAHYDPPPPDTLDLENLLRNNEMRFANELRAWIEVEDGVITNYGQSGRGYIGKTKVGFGALSVSFTAIPFHDLQSVSHADSNSVRFVQTCGGHTGAPVPAPIKHAPYFRLQAPLAWTTLALTLHADGKIEHEVVEASPFPRHWIYNHQGQLVEKSGLIEFTRWFTQSPEPHAAAEDNAENSTNAPVPFRNVESALERGLSGVVIGAQPVWRHLSTGETLIRQGETGDDVFLLFDGLLSVEKDGKQIAEVAPGAILGEMSHLTDNRRTATLRALTPCRVAVVPHHTLNTDALTHLAQSRTPTPPAQSFNEPQA